MFILVDCNSFFCSVERVFQPQLKNKPLIVLSSNDGCIVARTTEAKQTGLPMGAPIFKWRETIKKHNVQMRSSNFTLIGDFHRRVMQILKDFNLETEVYSIDEAFIQINSDNKEELQQIGQSIRKAVLKATDIPVSVGIAKTKTLAKVANFQAKQQSKFNGVCSLITNKEHINALQNTPIEEVWGVGRKSSQKLRINYQVKTAFDFANLNNYKKILNDFSILGLKTFEELNQTSHFKLHQATKPRKGLLCSRSFGKKIKTQEHLKQALASHIANAAEKLRKQGSLCRRLTIFIRASRNERELQRNYSTYMTINPGTSDTLQLINTMSDMLPTIYESHISYKKCGVYFSDLISTEEQQLNLFSQADTHKNKKLMSTIDEINKKYGKETIKPAQCGANPFWKPLCEIKSPCYTTRFSELLEAHC